MNPTVGGIKTATLYAMKMMDASFSKAVATFTSSPRKVKSLRPKKI